MINGRNLVRVTHKERNIIIGLYTSGNTNILSISRIVSRPVSTVYYILKKSGVHKPKKQENPRQAKPVSRPRSTPVEPEAVTLVRAPRRGLLERIKDFFA